MVAYVGVVVAERVVKVAHPYLGTDVEVQLWSPLDDVEDPKALPASHSAVNIAGTPASSDAPDPIVYCVKKRPTNHACSLPDSCRSDDDRSLNSLEKKPSVESLQSKTTVPTVSARQKTRRITSNADNRHLKNLPIAANSEVQFCLLKEMLGNRFARDHGCTFTADEHNLTITLSSERDNCISVLAEEVYGYMKDGTFEDEVHLLPGLAQLLYTTHKQWLYDRLRRKMNKPALLKMATDGRLVVVAFSRNTATEAVEKISASLLRGKVPLNDQQHKLAVSAKFHKKLNEIMTDRAIAVKTGAREICVDGLPHDVVCAVSEIDQYLYK